MIEAVGSGKLLVQGGHEKFPGWSAASDPSELLNQTLRGVPLAAAITTWWLLLGYPRSAATRRTTALGDTREPIQLAMGEAADDGTRTDATVALDAQPGATFKDGIEVAGPGPTTSTSYQQKVQSQLEHIDLEVADWWRAKAGVIRSRSASGWLTFWRDKHFSTMENGRPVVVVDENYTLEQTVVAIVDEARHGPAVSIRPAFLKDWGSRGDRALRLRQAQAERFKRGAAFAGWAAKTYYSVIGSLTPAGDVVVTVDDAAENGLRWDHFLILLPLMPLFRKGVKRLIVNLPGGRRLQVSGDVLERLLKLDPADRNRLIASARAAKTEEEGLAIIERGVGAAGRAPAHHIATNKNWVSTLRGGPWSPRFEKMFERAGMNLEDAENVVNIPGHAGPHPELYHQEIFDRLTAATTAKRGAAYKTALVAELKRIAKEASTAGTKLNRLLTE
jgi:A nuclease family of the HNH/ENDO VII superfamily with conserved AHH